MEQNDTGTTPGQQDDLAALLSELESLRRQVDDLRTEAKQVQAVFVSLVNSVPDIIYQLDAEGRISFISDAVRRYGYDPGRLRGVPFLDLIHPDDHKRARFRVNERRTGKRRTRSLEVRLLTGDHSTGGPGAAGSQEPSTTTLELHAEGLYREDGAGRGSFVGTQGVARDITDRLRAEEVQRQAEQVRVFSETAGAAAHEINQPLTVILGTVEMIRARLPADHPLHADLQEVQAAGRRIADIVLQMRTAHRYVTKPYMAGRRIIDFEASSDAGGPPAGEGE